MTAGDAGGRPGRAPLRTALIMRLHLFDDLWSLLLRGVPGRGGFRGGRGLQLGVVGKHYAGYYYHEAYGLIPVELVDAEYHTDYRGYHRDEVLVEAEYAAPYFAQRGGGDDVAIDCREEDYEYQQGPGEPSAVAVHGGVAREGEEERQGEHRCQQEHPFGDGHRAVAVGGSLHHDEVCGVGDGADTGEEVAGETPVAEVAAGENHQQGASEGYRHPYPDEWVDFGVAEDDVDTYHEHRLEGEDYGDVDRRGGDES